MHNIGGENLKETHNVDHKVHLICKQNNYDKLYLNEDLQLLGRNFYTNPRSHQGTDKDLQKFLTNGSYKKVPFENWNDTCSGKRSVGIGMKNLDAWNKAYIAKLVQEIAKNKDLLQVKWVHDKYLSTQNWWVCKLRHDVCQY